MKHFIITRCKFKDEETFEKYFEMMKKYFFPSLNNQTNKNFTLVLICYPNHLNKMKKEIDKKINVISFLDQKKDYREFITKLDETIQTRHDCDDYMSPNYVEEIQKLHKENKNKFDSFILNFHPTKFVDSTQKEYTHSRDYSKVCSMFSSLIQKNTKHGIFDVMHDHLVRISKNVIYINKPFVKLVIHGNNTLSKLNPKDQELKK
jgi:hypothetical protein